jgi:hypothetical protein
MCYNRTETRRAGVFRHRRNGSQLQQQMTAQSVVGGFAASKRSAFRIFVMMLVG